MKLTLEQWKSRVSGKQPKAKFKKGGGYGSSTDWIALIGSDTQNPVAVYSPENEFWSIEGAGEGQAKDATSEEVKRLGEILRAAANKARREPNNENAQLDFDIARHNWLAAQRAVAKDALPAKIVRRAKLHRALDAVLDKRGK